MKKEAEKRPLKKVKVRVKRADENSRASAQYESLSDSPDLIDEVLPTVLEENIEEGSVHITACAEIESAEVQEPVVFVPIQPAEEEQPESASDVCELERVEEVLPTAEYKAEEKAEKQRMKVFTSFSDMSLLRKILAVVFLLFSLWSLLPAFAGIIGIGLFAPLLIGLFMLFTVTAWDFICEVKSRLWKALWIVIAVVAMAGIIAFAFVSGHMISASNNTIPANNSNVTVVVLGCKVNGTQPSRMLAERLDTAADYLLTHPGVNCIVTGGMGSDENIPEAVVMKQYLVEKGVSAGRIKIDDQSTSTRENISNALEVANDNNYYTTFYIVTDRFHQLRAGLICQELGITSYALSCETPWYLAVNYWFREMFALAYHTVTKN